MQKERWANPFRFDAGAVKLQLYEEIGHPSNRDIPGEGNWRNEDGQSSEPAQPSRVYVRRWGQQFLLPGDGDDNSFSNAVEFC